MVFKPPGVEKRPRPSEMRPEALIRSRCPLRTTKPLFVQPLLALSALTPTLIVKKVGFGFDAGTVFTGRSLTLLSGGVLGFEGRIDGGLFRATLSSRVALPVLLLGLPFAESNSIDSTSST